MVSHSFLVRETPGDAVEHRVGAAGVVADIDDQSFHPGESFEYAIEGGIGLFSIMEGWEHMGRHALAKSFGTYGTAVMGLGGDGTSHALWRVKNGNFKNLRPRLVVIMIGTNDLESQSEQEIVDGITAVAQAVNAITPDSKILLLGLFPRGEDRVHYLRAPIRRVNEGMQKLADDETIYYRDFGAFLLNEDGTARRDIQPDHLHLSREGYRVWAAALAPVVAELME